MIIKNKLIEINENDIFKNDKLERKETIENLSSLITTTSDAFTLSINADWGAGKTTFIKLWQTYLKREKDTQSIYFSAWEDDFSKEPLISILGAINQYISDNYKNNKEIEEKFEKVKKVGGKIFKRGIPAFLKGATAGVVDIDSGFEEAIGAIAESSATELIENYSKDKAITKEFDTTIRNLLSKINGEKPFVIFIDELDRCRPPYAIELLERIKHIFGIDGLIFILGIDKKQLSESIKSQYGNIDTDNYLKRFIDMEYNLQNPSIENFCTYLYKEIYSLHTELQAKQIKKEHANLDELAMIKYLAKSLNLSLREIEQIFIQLSIVFKTIEPRLLDGYFRIIVLFIVLKMKFSQQYKLLLHKKIKEQDLIDLLVSKKVSDNSSRDLRTIIKAIILATSKTEIEFIQVINKQKSILNQISDENELSQISDENEVKEQNWLINLLEGSEDLGFCMLNQAIEKVIKQVEFADSFNFEGVE